MLCLYLRKAARKSFGNYRLVNPTSVVEKLLDEILSDSW